MSDDECRLSSCEMNSGASSMIAQDRLVSDEKREELDQVLKVASESRRRDILYYLQSNNTCEIDELATHLVSKRRDFESVESKEETLNQIKTNLVHSDLPMLEEALIIQYDQRSGVVRCSDLDGLLKLALDACAKVEHRSIV